MLLLLTLVGEAPAAPPPDLDLSDLDQWDTSKHLFAESVGCWRIAGDAQWEEHVSDWSRSGRRRLEGTFQDGRWIRVEWSDVGTVDYDTPSGKKPGVMDAGGGGVGRG